MDRQTKDVSILLRKLRLDSSLYTTLSANHESVRTIMKTAAPILLANALASIVSARPWVDQAPLKNFNDGPEERYLIELGPDDLRWVTEDEKWRIRRVSDLHSVSTDTIRLGESNQCQDVSSYDFAAVVRPYVLRHYRRYILWS